MASLANVFVESLVGAPGLTTRSKNATSNKKLFSPLQPVVVHQDPTHR